ncbi:sedoheptulokinase-like [Actinia tenebrosa]|uniref:Sedoheptulokinase n=1 Tax=Actinia tenebrosa TaxID=6105 RepID=A0A6P8J3F0_ACTTE|nr:sedoheptulokinase-like [Actinia tenebrosa]
MADKTLDQELFLGIDLGTTSVKVTLLDYVSKKVLMFLKEDTKAVIVSNQSISSQLSEQNVGLIFTALNRILTSISAELRCRVQKIGICGQMHGCVFWKKGHEKFNIEHFNESGECDFISHLITWEDQRCSTQFLNSLPKTENSLLLSTGFGCATIFWFARNNPSFLSTYEYAGTVQDLLVALLCGTSKPIMSTQNAFSWGYYNLKEKAWEKEMLENAGFPVHFLPTVREPGTVSGVLPRAYLGIPAGAQISIALGDLQCSVLASLEQNTDAVLNIGTSSQIAVIVPSQGLCSYNNCILPSIQFWPFFDAAVVAVAASLTGGNALATFVATLQDWMKELGMPAILSKQELYAKLLKWGEGKTDTSLNIRPTLWGERHQTNLTGNVSCMSETNISLGDITASLCNGVINNLQTLMPRDWLISCGVKRIVGTGNALARNAILQKQTEKVWGLPLVIKEDSDASHGAALALFQSKLIQSLEK